MKRLVPFAALALSACITPRSMVLGQTAAMPERGFTEAALSGGFMYQSQSSTQSSTVGTTTTTSSSTAAGFTFPFFEANLQFGLADMVALNVHASSAGLAPGAKIALLKGEVALAVLPEIAFGFQTQTVSASYTTGGVTNSSAGNPATNVSWLVGLRVLVSTAFGLYGGLGYQFQSYSYGATTSSFTGSTSESSAGVSSHNIQLAVGYDLAAGHLRLRPELALMIAPAGGTSSSSVTSGTTTTTPGGFSAFAILPNVTVAVGK